MNLPELTPVTPDLVNSHLEAFSDRKLIAAAVAAVTSIRATAAQLRPIDLVCHAVALADPIAALEAITSEAKQQSARLVELAAHNDAIRAEESRARHRLDGAAVRLFIQYKERASVLQSRLSALCQDDDEALTNRLMNIGIEPSPEAISAVRLAVDKSRHPLEEEAAESQGKATSLEAFLADPRRCVDRLPDALKVELLTFHAQPHPLALLEPTRSMIDGVQV